MAVGLEFQEEENLTFDHIFLSFLEKKARVVSQIYDDFSQQQGLGSIFRDNSIPRLQNSYLIFAEEKGERKKDKRLHDVGSSLLLLFLLLNSLLFLD